MAKLKNIVHVSFVLFSLAYWMLFVVISEAEEDVNNLKGQVSSEPLDLEDDVVLNFLVKFFNSLKGSSTYTHVWPEMEIGWRIIVGTTIAFCGAAFGSAAGVGAGGLLVPMLTLVLGFDAKSSTAISKCMIMELTGATVCCNIKQKHPTLDHPLIDYDLALLLQPMLLLGISTGVVLNVIFANWMITILLIIAFIGTATRSFFKGVEMWKTETIKKKEAAQLPDSNDQLDKDIEYKPLPGGPSEQPQEVARLPKSNGQSGNEIECEPLTTGPSEQSKNSTDVNVCWRQLAILVTVWFAFLAIQILKDFTTTCSVTYWVLNLLQVPVAVGATFFQIVKLHRRNKVTNSTGEVGGHWRRTQKLVICAFVALLAGTLGGLLGLGGGFLLAPMLLEIGIIPQVLSATATFVMAFSSSLSAIQYYLLRRFPIPYTLYLVVVAILASLTGQYAVRSWITRVGRESLIVFILTSIIFASAISLGGQGIADTINKVTQREYMGFEDICA